MSRIAAATAALLAALAAGAETRSDAEQAAAELAIATLTAEPGVARESIEVAAVRAVEWRNSSLGCPKPGKLYLDVVTKGYEVTLLADGRVHVLHVAGNRAFECRSKLRGIKPVDATRKPAR
jgi:hypothetical protein